MKSFWVAAVVAIVSAGSFAGDASAASAKMKRAGMGSMGGMAATAMAPGMLAAGAALIGSSGYVGGPVVTPYGASTYLEPVTTPYVYTVPVIVPTIVPMPGGILN